MTLGLGLELATAGVGGVIDAVYARAELNCMSGRVTCMCSLLVTDITERQESW